MKRSLNLATITILCVFLNNISFEKYAIFSVFFKGSIRLRCDVNFLC